MRSEISVEVVSVDGEVEARHDVFSAVLANVSCFIVFANLLCGISNILLSVRVKEPVGSDLDHRADKFVTALSLSVLVGDKDGERSAANAVRNRSSLIILSVFNHLH